MNETQIKYLAGGVLLVGVMAYFLGRKKRPGEDLGGVTVDTGCTSSMSENTAYEIATNLKSIFGEWYVSDTDETAVKQLCRSIPDECGAKKVHQYFGTLETVFYGDGDLNYFCRSRLTEPTKDAIRPYFGVTANF